mgnify:CR=1 FL=1
MGIDVYNPPENRWRKWWTCFWKRLGLLGHQTIYGVHYDTDNYHLHIAVNRANPETGKVVLPFNGLDIQEAHKLVAHIEGRQDGQRRNPMYAYWKMASWREEGRPAK